MPYAFIQDVPANEPMYREIRAMLPSEPPDGMVAHLVIKRDTGLQYVDVWATEADWTRFRDDHVEPAVRAVLTGHGITHDHSMVSSQPIEIIDAWLGAESPD